MNVPRLAKWIAKLPPQEVVKIGIYFLHVSGEQPVEVISLLPEKGQAPKSPVDLAREILDSSQLHCDSNEYQSRYAVRALNIQNEMVVEQNIVCRPQGFTDPAGVGDPSLTGIVQQVLRHNEALMRMVFGAMDGTLSAQNTVIESQKKIIEDFYRRERARIEVAQQEKADENDVEKVARAEALLKIGDAVAEHIVPRMGALITPGEMKQ
jgi:hypothetical protein